MSVVVRDEATGKVWLLTKGAESSVLQRCRAGDSDHQRLITTTAAHIDDYAMVSQGEMTDSVCVCVLKSNVEIFFYTVRA